MRYVSQVCRIDPIMKTILGITALMLLFSGGGALSASDKDTTDFILTWEYDTGG